MRRLKKLEEFFLTESIVKYSDDFLNILSKIHRKTYNDIAGDLILMSGHDHQVASNFIDLGAEDDLITFTPDKKAEELLKIPFKNVFNSNRQPMKIGRFVKSFLKDKNYSDKEIEEFVNLYKSTVSKKDEFRLVSGEEISYWYNQHNYEELKSTLGNSCMKSVDRDFFEIYEKNPDTVKLLILMGKEKEDKIRGRALIWYDVKESFTGEKITFMDRVYYTNDSDIKLFHDYAKKMGWGYKKNLNHQEKVILVLGEKEIVETSLTVDLIETDFDCYPYMDTFKFLNENGELKNYAVSRDRRFNRTDGGYDIYCSNCNSSGRVWCDCDNGRIRCEDCLGSGNVTCQDCGGEKVVECVDCDGEGEFECQKCNGTALVGEETCDDCKLGYIQCDHCEGFGYNACQNCNRRGKIICPNCYGEGYFDCDECDGEGRIDCSVCSD